MCILECTVYNVFTWTNAWTRDCDKWACVEGRSRGSVCPLACTVRTTCWSRTSENHFLYFSQGRNGVNIFNPGYRFQKSSMWNIMKAEDLWATKLAVSVDGFQLRCWYILVGALICICRWNFLWELCGWDSFIYWYNMYVLRQMFYAKLKGILPVFLMSTYIYNVWVQDTWSRIRNGKKLY